ncbi:DUF6503 family protein [Winogradskyella sp.]|uniref:DUF6503 family protein n=1 Tax=Winogradskyella sp. TaxID=1883156 RepID=UPI003F6B5C03
MKYLTIFIIALLLYTCKGDNNKNSLSANEIINRSIEVSGDDRFSRSNITFDFRDKSYAAKRLGGKFSYARMFKEDSLVITDFLSNKGFRRMIGREIVEVEDSMQIKYSASVNSVHYFSVIPYGLNDKAVNKELLTDEQINNKSYYKIRVTFKKEGGGEDYEDVFVYWINKQTYKADYLAYSYNEEDGVGMRFREAYNERYVNGLRFVDYNNFKTEDASVQLLDLGEAFEQNQLRLLSQIELKNVEVNLIDL